MKMALKICDSTDMKLNFVNRCKSSYCEGCLSTNRTLSSLNEYADIYRNICGISQINTSIQVRLCWECMAVLKRIKLFKTQVEEAQKIIACLSKRQNTPTTLSRLTNTYNNDMKFITHNDKMTPKVEIYHNDENLDNCESLSNYSVQNINKNERKIKKEIIKKPKHYRFVYDTGVSKKRLLRKKLSIKQNEIELWLTNEKRSQFYRKFKYKCKYCSQGWDLKEKLDAHTLKYHTHRKVQCLYCEATFKNRPQFFKHYKSMHSVFICDHCGKTCKSKRMIEKHMCHHSDNHTCNACHKRYKSLAALRKHFSTKHRLTLAEQAYCVLCDKQYDNVLVYKRHVQSSAAHAHERDRANAKKSISCPQCENSYSRRSYMINHYRHVHMNQSKYYCTECDRHFLNRTKYIDHMKYNHEGVKKEKNKMCNICGRGFFTNRILINHIRTHSGERPFECESCGAKFTQKHSMLSHIKFIHMKSSRRSHC